MMIMIILIKTIVILVIRRMVIIMKIIITVAHLSLYSIFNIFFDSIFFIVSIV